MENNTSNEKTSDISDRNTSSPDWRERYGYRRHFFLPKLIIIVIVIGFAFMAGAMVSGSHGYRGGFIQPKGVERKGIDRHFGGNEMMLGHGEWRGGQQTLGSVVKVDGDTLTILQNDVDVIIKVAADTSIYKNKNIAKSSDIKVGSVIIVRGAPGSDGTITAQVIVIN